jgi:aconitate hydratase
MGVLPLQFNAGANAASLKLTGQETYDLQGTAASLKPGGEVIVIARSDAGTTIPFTVTARIDTPEELEAYRHGGILPYVLRQLLSR